MYPPPRTEESFWLRSSFVPYEERAELFLLTLLDQVRDYQFYTKEGSLGKFMFVFIGNCPICTYHNISYYVWKSLLYIFITIWLLCLSGCIQLKKGWTDEVRFFIYVFDCQKWDDFYGTKYRHITCLKMRQLNKKNLERPKSLFFYNFIFYLSLN